MISTLCKVFAQLNMVSYVNDTNCYMISPNSYCMLELRVACAFDFLCNITF